MCKSWRSLRELQQQRKAVQTIAPNEVKSGQVVLLAGGDIVTVRDNKKGIAREIETDNGGRGSAYVFDWDCARNSAGEMCEVKLPASYLAKKDIIANAGIIL